MRAVVIREHGGPEVLREEQVDKPEPGPGQVRIRVRSVAVNHLDIWVRKGGPAFKLEYPHRLGSDISGDIDAVGPGCSPTIAAKIGQKTVVNPGVSCGVCLECLKGADNLCREYRILGENTQGGYGEFAVVPAANLAPFPEGLSYDEAACVLLPFLTAWQMLVDKARVAPGQWVLVQGGASGVGVAAIQIARLFGARVIATASTDAKLAKCKELGAEVVVNYLKEDFVKATRKATAGTGAEIVFEHVGGETFEKSVKATRNGGCIVTCGATSGPKPTIDLRHVFFRQLSVLGSTMGSKSALLRVLEFVEKGQLKPVVDRTLPLSQVGEAHQLLENRGAIGKVVLSVV